MHQSAPPSTHTSPKKVMTAARCQYKYDAWTAPQPENTSMSQQNPAMPWSKPRRRSLLIVTKMSLFRLRRRQHRKSRKPAEAAARSGRDLRATAAGGITSASPGTKEAGTLRTQRGRPPRKVAAPRVVAMTIEKMVEGRCRCPCRCARLGHSDNGNADVFRHESHTAAKRRAQTRRVPQDL